MNRGLLFATVVVFAACVDASGPVRGIGPADLQLQEVASGFSGPIYVTAPQGDSRLFIVEQRGRIKIFESGQLGAAPFLDITSRVSTGFERGLLSMVFHPQYATNGFFYVFFTGASGELRIERYTVSANRNAANAGSAKVILTVPHPRDHHNGGTLAFGPDGMLYAGLGDGGGAGDPDMNGQNQNTLLGAILRIDVDNGDPYAIPAGNPFAGIAGARAEIWAMGLRNPWRYSFDRVGGNLYVADVGQARFEEINIVPANRAGVNYGWRVLEGSACFEAQSCNRQGLETPVLEYDHSDGSCAVTGGYVYRGAALPEVQGHYFYGDYCGGWVRSFRYAGGAATEQTEWDFPDIGRILSFGEDSAGELYVITDASRVYRIVRR